MIKIFGPKENNFNSNGIVVIHPFKLIETKKISLNGWFIDVEASLEYEEHLKQDMLCVVKVKSKLKPQAFRIKDVKKNQRMISFQAEHVMFDTRDYFLVDARPTNMSAIGALNYVNERTDSKSPFNFTSDVNNSSTAYFIRKNLLEALTVIEERWGGYFEADNWNISLKKNVGHDRDMVVSYGKNLESIQVTEDWSNVVTRLYPVGFDGLTIPGNYIESKVKYDKPYTKTVHFETEYEDEDRTKDKLLHELIENAHKYIEKNQYPMVNYEVKSNINDFMEIGDLIHVKHPLIDIQTRVQEYTYNIVSKRVESLVFGNYSRDVKKRFDAIKDDIKSIKGNSSNLEALVGHQTDLINSLNKDGHLYIDENQMMVLDKLPMKDARNVWRWNLGGLGFSENGIESPFKQAWTIDGKFNTDFIAANSIMTNQLHSDVGSSLDISANKSLNLLGQEINIVAGDLKGKLNKGEAAKDINNGTVNIRGDRINLEGYTTINNNFWVDTSGNMGAKNADIQGKIIAVSGSIGNLKLEGGVLKRTYSRTTKKYTTSDENRVRAIIMGTITPTSNDYLNYDLNGDGEIDTSDMMIIRGIMNSNNNPATIYFTLEVGKNDASLETIRRIDNLYTFKTNIQGSTIDTSLVRAYRVQRPGSPLSTLSLGDTTFYIGSSKSSISANEDSMQLSSPGYIDLTSDANLFDKLRMRGNVVIEHHSSTNNQARANIYQMNPRAGHGGTIGLATNRYSVIYLQNQPNVSSDLRYKNLITVISDDLLDVVHDIKPKQYYTIYDNKVHFGYIAQDVERALYKHALRVYGREKANQVVDDFAMLSKDESYMSLLYGEIQVLKDAYYQRELSRLNERLNNLERSVE